MKKKAKLFIIGAMGYTFLEILWRGHSHWSMAIAGGISLVTLFSVFKKLKNAPIYFKALVGGIIVTVIEFVFGTIFNLGLGMKIWDYSAVKGNILGQICPLYSILWCMICVPVSIAEKLINERKIVFERKALP